MALSMVESAEKRTATFWVGVVKQSATFTLTLVATTTAMLGTTTRLAAIQFLLAERVPLVSLVP